MKKLIGLGSLLDEYVTIWCECYIYAGKLIGVNEKNILLTDAKVVYDTGVLDKSGFLDAQNLPGDWYIRTAKIESYGKMK
jgi:hypothetical protein